MTTHTTQNWNASKDRAATQLTDVSDYVLIGRKSDGQSFVMSNGDRSLAEDLFSKVSIGQSEGANIGG